jgi:hypothetical protein
MHTLAVRADRSDSESWSRQLPYSWDFFAKVLCKYSLLKGREESVATAQGFNQTKLIVRAGHKVFMGHMVPKANIENGPEKSIWGIA